ncbi:hypothetical protein [Salipaludibacillus sp. CF4.18]|uniref:hypothetical protein n=1 Tax=Salipaludibacillus sp. CF4.18 TaxID=3373081 RepID=UPI003EE46BEE
MILETIDIDNLARNTKVKCSLKVTIENGLPILGECGGFMYLSDSIETSEKTKHKMVGVVSGNI